MFRRFFLFVLTCVETAFTLFFTLFDVLPTVLVLKI